MTESSKPPNPYVGPVTFTYDDRRRYFGREREARALLSLVIAERLTLFYAQSGAGKSSLLNTRLIPALREQARYLVLPVGRVGGEIPHGVTTVDNIYAFNLMLSLDRHKTDADPNRFAHLTLPAFLDGLRTTDGLYYEYNEATAQRAAAQRTSAVPPPSRNQPPHVLIIDQFEEIITAHPQRWRERTGFFHQLADAMRADPLLWVVLTLREDFVAPLDPFADLMPGRLSTRFYMERMGIDAALAAIQRPAAAAGHPFTDEAAQRLVNNLCQVRIAGQEGTFPGQSVEPVQLQVVCYQLWENLPAIQETNDDPTEGKAPAFITTTDLQQSGDVDTALADFYEQAIKRAVALPDLQVSERQLRTWFDKELITDANTRGTVYRDAEETADMPNSVVDDLQNHFLLRTEVRAGGAWVELIHDRFVEPIQRANAAWRTRYYNPLDKARARWLDSGGQEEWLLTETDLAEAEAFAHQHPLEVTAEEAAFLERIRSYVAANERRQAERAALEQEREEARQREVAQQRQLADIAQQRAIESETNALRQHREARRLRWLSAGLLIVALVAAVITWIAIKQSNLAVARGLITEARHQLEIRDLRLATLLALAAEELAPDEVNQLLTYNIPAYSIYYIRKVTSYQGRVSAVKNMALSPDGRTLAAGSWDGTIELWTIATGEVVQIFQDSKVSVSSLAWSPDGRTLASASGGGTIKLWAVATGEVEQTLRGHAGDVNSVAWSPNGRILASASHDNKVKLCDVAAGEIMQTWEGGLFVTSVAWSPDGRTLASGAWDNTIKLWSVATGETVQTLQGHIGGITSIAWSPDGRTLASGARDNSIKLWSVMTGEAVQTLQGHAGDVTSVAWSPDGHILASASDDSTIKLWTVPTGEIAQTLHGHTGSVNSVAWSPGGYTLASGGAWDGNIKLWEVAIDEAAQTLRSHTKGVNSVVWSPDGHMLASAAADNTIKLWAAGAGEIVHTLQDHTTGIFSVAWSPDGRTLASGAWDGTIKLWDVVTGETVQTLQGHTGRVNNVAWGPDGRTVASGGWDETIKLWDVVTGETVQTLQGHTSWVNSVAWSPDGRTLASASSDGTIKLWSVATGKTMQTLQGYMNVGVNSVTWSPDGRALASGTSLNTIYLWSVTTGEIVQTFEGHVGGIESLAWSPDGRTLASASDDGTIKLWTVATGEVEQTLQGHAGDVNSVAWSPNGRILASASDDTVVKLWSVQRIPDPCLLVYENFSITEWIHYRPWTVYRPLCAERPTPSLPSVLAALEEGNMNLLLITWPRRFVILGLGLIGTFIVVLLQWWLFKFLKSGKRALSMVIVTALLLAWFLFGLNAPTNDWTVYVVAIILGLMLTTTLWGIYRLIR